jgi:hypothetical protein
MTCATDQSRTLIDNILSSAQGRQEAMDALKSGVAGLLTDSRMQHVQSFRDTHARLCECVSGVAAKTRAFLAQCGDERCAVAQRRGQAANAQRRRAAEDEAARLYAFQQMHDRHARTCGQIARDVGSLAASTRSFLQDCDTRQRAVGDDVQQAAWHLRRALTGEDHARRFEFGRLHGRLAGQLAELRQTVHGHLAETRHGLTAIRTAWQHLAATRPDGRRTRR